VVVGGYDNSLAFLSCLNCWYYGGRCPRQIQIVQSC